MKTHADLVQEIGVQELANALGFSPQRVNNWRARNKIPHNSLVKIALMRRYQSKIGGVRRILELKYGK